MEELTKSELSLLLYFESQCVDYGGLLQSSKMNADDFEIAKRWRESGFIKFGRIKLDDIKEATGIGNSPRDHWCTLSDEAWNAAHQERRARFNRIESKLTIVRNGYAEA